MADSDSGGGFFSFSGIGGILIFLYFIGAFDSFLGDDKKDPAKEVKERVYQQSERIVEKPDETKLIITDVTGKDTPPLGISNRRWVTVLRDSNGTITRKAISPARPRVITSKGRTIIEGNFVNFDKIMVAKDETYIIKRE